MAMRSLLLVPVLVLSGCRSTYACQRDADCTGGQVCVTFKLTLEDHGSSCRTLCTAGCPEGLHCTGCPESPQRCTLTDGGVSGGFCVTPDDTLYPLP